MQNINVTDFYYDDWKILFEENQEEYIPLPQAMSDTPESRLYQFVVLQTLKDAALASTRKEGMDTRSFREAMRDSREAIGYIFSFASENDFRTVLEWAQIDPDFLYEVRSLLKERHSAKWLADVVSCYDKQEI